MTKLEFILSLSKKLSGAPEKEAEERIAFYVEAIEDRIEDGLSEEDAVADVGSVDDIATEILSEIPLVKIVTDKIKPKKKLRTWEIVLLAVGSPVWLPLLIAAIAVGLAIYASVWAIIVSLWAVFGSVIGCAVGGVTGALAIFITGEITPALALFGAGIFLGGLSIFVFFGCKEATRGILKLTKWVALEIKKCFIKKEELQ